MSPTYDFAMICPQRSLSAELLLQELGSKVNISPTLYSPSTLIESPPSAKTLIVLNYSIENTNTKTLVDLIRHNFSNYQIFLLLEHQSEPQNYVEIENLVGLGFQSQSIELLVAGFEAAALGQFWLPRAVCEAMLSYRVVPSPPKKISGLTEKEQGLVKLLQEGCTNRDMARLLNVSENTVKTHLKSIYRKLDAHSRTQAIARLSA